MPRPEGRALRDVVAVSHTRDVYPDLGPGFIAPLPEYHVEWADGTREPCDREDWTWYAAAVDINLRERLTPA